MSVPSRATTLRSRCADLLSAHRRWLWPLGFAVVYLALRVFWLTCDSGVPSTWEYGFHGTDEGYYLCGGKEMYLWGSFVNLTRQEALNYCFSYGTHWLSYLAHLCFGLSTWTWRLPFSLLYFAGWLMMFRYVARRLGGGLAFATCLAASSVPLVLTYERCVTNDALIAALTAIAFGLAAGRGRWRLFASAFALSLVATVKFSVWVMVPVVLSALLAERRTRSRWLDAALFCATVTLLAFGWKGLSALSVLGVARASGLSPWEVLAQVNAKYGLPSILDFVRDLKAFASFPRDPAIRILGPVSILITAVPAAMLLVNLVRRRWSRHSLLYLTMPLYAFALNIINSMYAHYFLPLVILLPALVVAIREDLEEDRSLFRTYSLLLAPCSLCLLVLVPVLSIPFDLKATAPFYSVVQNLPVSNPWRMTWPFLLGGTAVGVAALAFLKGRCAFRRESWIWAAVFLLVLSVSLSALPGAVLADRIHLEPAMFYGTIAMNLFLGGLFAFVLFVRPAVLARPLAAAALLVVPILVSYAALPTWRTAAVELLTLRRHYNAELAEGLRKILPANAVLLGERSDQALMSLPIRAVTTGINGSNPIPYIEKLHREDPDTPFYVLVDPECPYNFQYLRAHEKEYALHLAGRFRMPSSFAGKPEDVYLFRIALRY